MKIRNQRIVNLFAPLKTWEDRYSKLIELGRQLPKLADVDRVEDLKVKGCQSQVWLKAMLNERGNIIFSAESDALIVSGLVALLVQFYSDTKPEDVLASDPEFIAELGFESNLSPSRANGLYSMVKQIKYYAMAFRALQNSR